MGYRVISEPTIGNLGEGDDTYRPQTLRESEVLTASTDNSRRTKVCQFGINVRFAG